MTEPDIAAGPVLWFTAQISRDIDTHVLSVELDPDMMSVGGIQRMKQALPELLHRRASVRSDVEVYVGEAGGSKRPRLSIVTTKLFTVDPIVLRAVLDQAASQAEAIEQQAEQFVATEGLAWFNHLRGMTK